MIETKGLSFSYNSDATVFEDLNLKFDSNLNIIIGSNASGKTTLLKCIFGSLAYRGQIYWDDTELKDMDKKDRSELIAYLPQGDLPNSSLTVFETVLLGQITSLGWRVSQEQIESVKHVLNALGISDLADKKMSQLSGGQKKLVTIAQTLIRNPKLILMDEPTNNLDIQKQLELFEIIKQIIEYKNIQFIIVLHDINLALAYAENLIVLNSKDKTYKSGKANLIINPDSLREIYGINSEIIKSQSGKLIAVAESSVNKIKIFKDGGL